MIIGLAQHLKENYGITIKNMDYYDAAFTHNHMSMNIQKKNLITMNEPSF